MIRKGCMDDKPFIMGVIRDAVLDMELKGIHQWDSVYPDSDTIDNDISCGNLYIYEERRIIKGIIVLNEHQEAEYQDVKWEFKNGKQLIVHRLCVEPLYQGQGIARLLMKYAEQYGKEQGYESIRFDAFVNNRRACNLYEGLGYKAVGEVDFRKGKFYCYEKRLED